MYNSSKPKQFLEEARAFADKEILPRARDFDHKGALGRELIEKMAERKYLLASIPKQYGGLGLDPIDYGLFTEEIGKACCSTRSIINIQSALVGETLLKWGSESQRGLLPLMASSKKLGAFALSEPKVGSDAKGVQTTYTENSQGHVINGHKKWISFAGIADFFILIARDKNKVSAFIVNRNTKGVTIKPMKGLIGNRACSIAEIFLDNVVVRSEDMIGKPGSGFPYIVGTALDHGRYSIAWGGVAIAQACVDAMVTYARKREQFSKRIYEFQMIQGMIGDAVTMTHAARALSMSAGELRSRNDRQALYETTMAKYFASKVAREVATNAIQVHGGNGCLDTYPVERYFREAKILEIIEGTSQIQQQMIAMYGLREYSKR